MRLFITILICSLVGCGELAAIDTNGSCADELHSQQPDLDPLKVAAVCQAAEQTRSKTDHSGWPWRWDFIQRDKTFAHPLLPDKATCTIDHFDTDGDGCRDTGLWPLEFFTVIIDCPDNDCPSMMDDRTHDACVTGYYAITGCEEPIPETTCVGPCED